MKQLRFGFAFIMLLLCTFIAAYAQTESVTAEAIGQANLRAAPDTSADLLGQIVSGTRYPVIGRSEFYPWVLVADPATQQPMGWVFNDLVTIQGDTSAVPLSTLVVDGLPTPTFAAMVGQQPATTVTGGSVETVAGATATLAALVNTPVPPTAASAVIGLVNGEINVRYGPGTEYERLGVAEAGESFAITAFHTQLPWVQIAYPASPNGYGWVLVDLLEIQGDLSSVTPITQTTFSLPTLTPTPSMVDQAAVGEISPEFAALGARLWERMIAANFDPQTSRLGGLFVMNLKTGETLAFDAKIAFSGMSLNKIAILATLFGRINDTPDDETGTIIGEAMICSENISTNRMLTLIGDGNPYTGASRVSEFYAQLDLSNSFIYTPYSDDPFITPQAPQPPPETTSDQVSAEPDPYNQITVSEMGTLLHAIYQCATSEDGLLIERFPGLYTPLECRKMLDVMSYNQIFNFMEAGVPEGVRVAHKHGWINDTHGDAGIVFSPGGDFIFVIALHNPTWMEFAETVPLISENTRDVYNTLNPDAPLEETHPGTVPECNLLGNQGVIDLLSPSFGSEPLDYFHVTN
ncbi:MAG: serine hydrolase [Chloroflexota bacterium]